MIYNSEALILNTRCYGDTSLICNLFTKKYGRLSIISKGARTLKNPNRAILQPAQFIDLHYYYKPSRNIQILKEASINKHFFLIHKNYSKIIMSYNIIDIMNQICKTDNPNEIIFRLVKTVLNKIDSSDTKSMQLYYVFFQIQLLRYLGYQPIIEHCAICDSIIKEAQYNFSIGQLTCHACTTSHHYYKPLTLTANLLTLIKKISNTHIDCLKDTIQSQIEDLEYIKKYLLYYLSFHVVNIKHLKSMALIK